MSGSEVKADITITVVASLAATVTCSACANRGAIPGGMVGELDADSIAMLREQFLESAREALERLDWTFEPAVLCGPCKVRRN